MQNLSKTIVKDLKWCHLLDIHHHLTPHHYRHLYHKSQVRHRHPNRYKSKCYLMHNYRNNYPYTYHFLRMFLYYQQNHLVQKVLKLYQRWCWMCLLQKHRYSHRHQNLSLNDLDFHRCLYQLYTVSFFGSKMGCMQGGLHQNRFRQQYLLIHSLLLFRKYGSNGMELHQYLR